MLHWYRKKDRKRIAVVLQLLGYSCALHGFLLVLIFIGYRDQAAAFVFSMRRSDLVDCEVIVMIDPVQSGNKSTQPAARMHVSPQKKVTPSKTAVVAQKKAVPAKKQPTKPVAKKIPPKKEVAKKMVPQKSEPKRIEPAKKVEPIKKVEQPKPRVAEKNTVPPVMQQAVPSAVPIQGADGPQKIVVSFNEAHHIYQEQKLQQELARHWKPPHGVPENTSCQVTGYVDSTGVIKVNIDKSSEILMFDVQARAAMLAMQIPDWMRGKSLTVTLS